MIHAVISFFQSLFDLLFPTVALLVSIYLAKSSWQFWKQSGYKTRIDWIMLEIKIPRENLKGPKAMDQFLMSIFNLRNRQNGPKEVYLDGEIPRWFSFEIVGYNRTTRLFMRLPRLLVHPVTASLYAQYPDVEVVEVDRDYIYDGPPDYHVMKKNGYEIYALEIQQKNDPAYVLNTFLDFETKVGDEKGRIMDSMAGIIEIIGKLKPEETCWIQFLCQPDTTGEWIKGAKKIVDEKFKSATQENEQAGGKGGQIRFRFRTQGEEKTLKRIEEKKGKAVYHVMTRMVYFAPKKIYNHDLPNRGMFGWMTQFSNDDQRVRKNDKVRTKVEWEGFPFIFPKRRLYWKGYSLYEHYRERFIPEDTFVGNIYRSYLLSLCFFHKPMILSSEELATFFHIPTNVVLTAVTMERIESKRMPAPSNLPS